MLVEKDNKLIVVNNLGKDNAKIILGSLIMTALCVYTFITENDLSLIIIGIIGTLFFGFGTILFIYRAISKKKLVVVDKGGITDNSSAVSIGFISWNDISNIEITTVESQKFITLTLYNEDKYLEELPQRKMALLLANKSSGYGMVNITLVGTNIDVNEFYQKIIKYIKDNKIKTNFSSF